jgi:plastocyanin
MSKYPIKPALVWTTAMLLSFACHAMRSSADPAPLPVTAGEIVMVAIKDFEFVPAVITIAPGQVVEWVNSDDEPHSVVAADQSFRSASLDTAQRFTRAFPGSGEFSYYCSLHPHMTGKVIVAQRMRGP